MDMDQSAFDPYLLNPGFVAPRSPSRRQPHESWHFNAADLIEREMQAAGHTSWGFVIYRTTYASDDDWAEFLRRLRFQMESTFAGCNGLDILEAFTLTVFSDQALYDGADTATIRAHFRQWSETAIRAEQPPPVPPEHGRSARYEFCIQVDEAALHSVVYDALAPPAPDPTNKGWVKLISKDWIPIEEDPRRRPGWEAGNNYEPIEGVTERDVGWMKVPYWVVMGEYYYQEPGLNGWRSDYFRPLEVVVI